ncbi:hypothetical protein [Nocardioides sp. Soil805]|uniref:hypothetical protein n=1 Tax=Nocardioides sp. Soil805 TaxID=1736416 RepID=UPI0012E39B91|nr:hypothetical protein [Nocardioides sp. Soil805]
MMTRGMVVAGVLVASALTTTHVAQAAAVRDPQGPCFSNDSDGFDRVVVKRKPVRTASGKRVADVRVVAGHYYANSSGGAEGTGEYWCVDLLPARELARRNPKITGTFTRFGQDQEVIHRGFEDYLYWTGSSPSMTSDGLAVDIRIEGRRLSAHRLVRATFPELPPLD